MPDIPSAGLWPKQHIALANLEQSLKRGKPKALIQMERVLGFHRSPHDYTAALGWGEMVVYLPAYKTWCALHGARWQVVSIRQVLCLPTLP